MKEIQVGLGERAYPILIKAGLLGEVGAFLHRQPVAKRYGVIADRRVAELYGHQLMSGLEQAGLRAELIDFEAGEANKNLATVGALASELAGRHFDRKDGLIALGGGVAGDIVGFLASAYMRGIPFVQVPTTLLAQVDSSVGGKTGVDIPEGKNLVGSFYQPRAVFIDSRVLRSLPKAELLNGLAEVIKYGIIHDRGFFDFLASFRQAILDLDLPVLENVIKACCTIKAKVVEADETETDLRRILNFGHTIGHAVEAASGYELAHGAAVAMGMVAAARIAARESLLSSRDMEKIRDLIAAFGLPVEIPPELDRDRIKEYLKTDKKTVAGRFFFVLPVAIGKVTITDKVSEATIDAVISHTSTR